MKNKYLVFFALFLFLVGFVNAQVRFGGRVSGSISNITDVHANSKSRGGFMIGALALIPISNNDLWFFQPEINYSAQGEFDQHFRSDGDYKQKIFLSFINVPLNVKLYFTDAESEFFVEGGPYFGIKIGESIQKLPFETKADDYEYSGFDFGANLGIGFSLDRNFEASLRYYYGFADQVKNDAANTSNHTSILNLGISYILP